MIHLWKLIKKIRCRSVCGLIFLLLLPVIAQATESNTLRPTVDRALTQWAFSGIGGDKYERVDDDPFDDATYINSSTVGQWQNFSVGTMTIRYPDSVQYWVRALYTGGTAGAAEIIVGRDCYDAEGGANYWCVLEWDGWCAQCDHAGSAADTLTLTASATDYWVGTFYGDPCVDSTAWDSTYWSAQTLRFGIYNKSIRTGGPPISQNRVTEIWVIYFWEEGVVEGNPRRRRIITGENR